MTITGRTEGNRTRSPERWMIVLAATALLALSAAPALAIPEINLQVGDDGDATGLPMTLKIVLLMTVLSLAPAFAVLVTSFTRIVIVLGSCGRPSARSRCRRTRSSSASPCS